MIAGAVVRVLLLAVLSDHLLIVQVRVACLADAGGRILGAVGPGLHHKCAPGYLLGAGVQPELCPHHVLYC